QGENLSVTISGANINYGNQWSNLSGFRFSQWSGSNMFYGSSTSSNPSNLYGTISIPPNQNTGYYDLEVYDNGANTWVQTNNAFYVGYSSYVNYFPCSVNSQVYFTKSSYSDWNLVQNRDVITPTCELTRASNGGIYNYVTQNSWNNNLMNSNIEYALGDFYNHGPWGTSLQAILGNGFGNSITNVGPITIHILDSDLYFELNFLSWSSGQSGGFSYTRTFIDNNCNVSIDSINPSSGNQGENLSVTISGTNINYGSQWSGLSSFRFSQWSGSNMFYGSSTSENSNNLFGQVSIPNNQTTGWYDLEVQDQNTNQWIQKNSAFYVNYTIPSIDYISPSYAEVGDSLAVSISGTNINYGNFSDLSDFRFSNSSSVFYGNPTSTNANSVPTSALTILFSAEGDLGSTGEYWTVYDEDGSFLTTVAQYGASDCNGWYTKNYTASANQIQSWFIDGSTHFTLYPTSSVNACSYNNVSATLSINGNIFTDTANQYTSYPNSASLNFNHFNGNELFGNVIIPQNQDTGWYHLEVYNQNTNQWVQKNNAFFINLTSGCTDSIGVNYNPLAVLDDSSCLLSDCDPTIIFNKADYSNWHLPQNRDQISPTCELTREDQHGLFNYVTQSNMYDQNGNTNIEYAMGTFDNITSPWFTLFRDLRYYTQCGGLNCLAGETVTIHVLDSDTYYELYFTSWSSSYQGGFSYERSQVSCSAEPLVYGCVNEFSSNYNSNANVDDGSCVYEIIISPDSAARGQSLPVFISGNSATDFNMWSNVANLFLKKLDGSCKIPIANNSNNWTIDSLTNSFGFHTNLDLNSYESTDVIQFQKPNNSNWHLLQNRDQISPTCELTREDQHGLFNYVTQSSMYDQNGNTNIEYAMGTFDNITSPWLTLFRDLRNYTQCGGLNCLAGETVTIHVLDSDTYYELYFTSWSSSNQGGFSYERTSINVPVLITEGVYSLEKSLFPSGNLCEIVDEGNLLTLTAPNGALITSIDFASYGTPSGLCGSFNTSICHSINSQSIVENACLNQNTCSILVQNSTFGDPCTGLNKQLAVEATYSNNPNIIPVTLNPFAFTVTQGPPQLISIFPNSETVGNEFLVEITGLSMFTPSSPTIFRLTNNTTTINGVSTLQQNEKLFGNITIPIFASSGVYDLEVFDVYTNQWIILEDAFTINEIEINDNRIYPNTANNGDSLAVFISGNQNEFENWSWSGGAPLRIKHSDGTSIDIVNFAFSNWFYIGYEAGFNTSIQIPDSATLGSYNLEVDHLANGDWSIIETAAFGIGTFGCSDTNATNYIPQLISQNSSCCYDSIIFDITQFSWNIYSDSEPCGEGNEALIGQVIFDNNGLGYLDVLDSIPFSWQFCGIELLIDFGTTTGYYYDNNTLIYNLLDNSFTGTFFTTPGEFQGIAPECILIQSSLGCTDSLAVNFDALATVDDGNCIYCSIELNTITIEPSSIFNCDGSAFVVVSNNIGDVSYNWNVVGMSDNYFINNLCQGEYIVIVTDSVGCSTTDTITIQQSGVVFGCTDSLAVNFDSSATIDDANCFYCTLDVVVNTVQNSNNLTCDGTAVVYATSSDGDVNYLWYDGSTSFMQQSLCTGLYSVQVYDDICSQTSVFTIGQLSGCLDSTALNYDMYATISDSSCIYPIPGCTDSLAFNYDINSNIDDGSCIAIIFGCTDTTAWNYDSFANTNSGLCQYCDLSNSIITFQNTLNNCDGLILSNASSSNLPITYLWSNGINTNNIVNLCSGIYILNITDAAGCSLDTSIIIGNTQYSGCTDPLASNYDANATIDDGSCSYGPSL
ncbi:SUEL-type lectin domain-containing protein, partial [Flavobacteriales bacterium]|nr:SUEL-type lectin domain-containing protein [Flavobacteriales bacterium]